MEVDFISTELGLNSREPRRRGFTFTECAIKIVVWTCMRAFHFHVFSGGRRSQVKSMRIDVIWCVMMMVLPMMTRSFFREMWGHRATHIIWPYDLNLEVASSPQSLSPEENIEGIIIIIIMNDAILSIPWNSTETSMELHATSWHPVVFHGADRVCPWHSIHNTVIITFSILSVVW